MLKLAIRDQPAFEISRVDIDRSPPHYAADSLIRIREIYPQAKVFYLMGEDSLRDLIHWHEPGRFLQQCDGIGVMRRVIDSDSLVDLQRMFPGTEQKVIFLEAPRFDISSREIRQRVAQGLPFRYFLPQAVYQYILRTGLYCA
jgi:nicotinate-nucleotide adenylyltransferase